MKTEQLIDFNSNKIKRYNKIRKAKDSIAKSTIAVGGIAVIAAILLIFLYLLYEVMPMFSSADVNEQKRYDVSHLVQEPPLYLSLEEQNEVALLVATDGEFIFFNAADGSEKSRFSLAVPEGLTVTAFAINSEVSRIMAFGLSDGSVLLAKHQYQVSYPDDKRLIEPFIEYPYGETPLHLADQALTKIAVSDGDENLLLLGQAGKQLLAINYVKEEDFMSDGVTLVAESIDMPMIKSPLERMFIESSQNLVFLLAKNTLYSVNVATGDVQTIKFASPLLDAHLLLGNISLLTSHVDGSAHQWFQLRQVDGLHLQHIRAFASSATEQLLMASEQRRKGFAMVNAEGEFQLYHSTAEHQVFSQKMFDESMTHFALSPRANRALVLADSGMLYVLEIKNEHPEVSFSSLWQEVWYESYSEPDYIWQSSASSNDFEPKLSLSPLAFGTLKAAFYAMLLGAPLAIFGAIYTAYFMTPMMRRKVKPLIELMEALPTVILGFLAGLWLAPFMESHMVGIFALFLVLPVGILAFAFAMSRLPIAMQSRINEGWHALLLIPVIIVLTLISFELSSYFEFWFFGGDMRAWLTNEMGIPFDQRNALVVGVAMGFAVIPTIFSIAEDAIFSVPKHLSYGSLALGATPWQTLKGVVLPTASPGIFSALMIGLGRAVGETMIVLMATGNTPIMDANIFEGMRTLSANLAVEIPEAAVDSTHYRVLFMAAFVLFLFTFCVNTIAEVIRQRLRNKYGSL